MLYLDSSALVKRYLREKGTDAVQARFHTGEKILTSALSYAEIHAALGRKYQNREIQKRNFLEAREAFIHDWLFSLTVLELGVGAMSVIKGLVEQHPLQGADAVHLSAALWLRDTCRLVPDFAEGKVSLEFAVADKTLGRVAAQCGLTVFNPENSP